MAERPAIPTLRQRVLWVLIHAGGMELSAVGIAALLNASSRIVATEADMMARAGVVNQRLADAKRPECTYCLPVMPEVVNG